MPIFFINENNKNIIYVDPSTRQNLNRNRNRNPTTDWREAKQIMSKLQNVNESFSRMSIQAINFIDFLRWKFLMENRKDIYHNGQGKISMYLFFDGSHFFFSWNLVLRGTTFFSIIVYSKIISFKCENVLSSFHALMNGLVNK